jgi:hypothetical protein
MQKWLSFSRTRRVIVLLLLALFCSGCIQQTVLRPDSSTTKALSTISSAVSETDMLTAMAQIDLVTPGGYYPARAALIIKKPAYMRLELLPPIGPPDFFLTVTPKEMKILLQGKGEFYQGAPTVNNLSRFLPWKFNIEDIINILVSTYPPLNDVVAYQNYVDGETLRIEMKAQSGITQILWLGANGLLLKLVRNDEMGKELYTAKFEDYNYNSSLAGKITVNMADGITSMTVKYTDLKIEKTSDLSIFDLPVPEGFKTIMMD